MVIFCTDERAKRDDVRVRAVSSGPLVYGNGYQVTKDTGEALLNRKDGLWADVRPSQDVDASTSEIEVEPKTDSSFTQEGEE